METLVDTLSDDEMLALGISPIIHGGSPDPDNAIVDAMVHEGVEIAQRDNEGRPVISYKQMIALREAGHRVDGYALRMTRPGFNKTWFIQASKLLKWERLGYVPVGKNPAPPRAVRRVEPAPTESADTVIYFCSDKYPDCKRFFDTAKGLEFHWKSRHEGALAKATKKDAD